jgi:hypothetical protein
MRAYILHMGFPGIKSTILAFQVPCSNQVNLVEIYEHLLI